MGEPCSPAQFSAPWWLLDQAAPALPERGKRDGSGEKGRAQGERTEHDGQSVLLVHASVQVAVPQVPAK